MFRQLCQKWFVKFKALILTWKANTVLDGQKILVVRNWKHFLLSTILELNSDKTDMVLFTLLQGGTNSRRENPPGSTGLS